jgi:hypothetical protein
MWTMFSVLSERVLAGAARLLGARGLHLRVRDDLASWVELLAACDSADGVNPTFDPRHSPVDPGCGFWLAVVDDAGDTVACCAYRVLRDGPFAELVRTGRLWFDPVPPPLRAPVPCVLPADAPDFRGTVGHIGGLWIRPDLRGLGLSGLLAQTTRAVAAQRYPIDWDTGVYRRAIAEKPRLVAAYQFFRIVPCVAGFFPPTGQVEQLHLGYSPRHHLLGRLRASADEWAAGHPADKRSDAVRTGAAAG